MHRRETVAEHTWNVLRIWDTLWGMPEPWVARRIMYHDVGEGVVGDPPFPVKRDNPDLKAAMDRIEGDAVARMVGVMPPLGPALSWRLKVCDLLDMMEVGIREVLMGNMYARPIVTGTSENINKICMYPPEGVTLLETHDVADYLHEQHEKMRRIVNDDTW